MPQPATITPEAISAISTVMIGITQLIKWAGVAVKRAPPILAILSSGVVLLWVYEPFWFSVLVASSLVMMAASGVYGFATRTTPPSPGVTVSSTTTTAETSGAKSSTTIVATGDPIVTDAVATEDKKDIA